MNAIYSASISVAVCLLWTSMTHALDNVRVFVVHRPENISSPWEVQADVLMVKGTATLVAPDGTTFTEGPGGWTRIQNLSIQDLTSRFAGTWRLDDFTGLSAGDAPRQHQFSVMANQFTPPTTPSTPLPVDGAILPPTFEMSWSGSGFTLIDTPPGALINFQPPQSKKTLLTVGFDPGQFERTLIARSNNQQSTPYRTLTPLDPFGAEKFEFSIVRNSHSLPVEWTVVVPEPSTLATASVAFLSLAVLRRRK